MIHSKMLRLLVLLSCVGLISAESYDPIVSPLDGRIVGGQTVTIAQFPYQLSLRLGNSHLCGAVIIGPNWALTAAHCIVGMSGTFSVRSGSSMTNSGGTINGISRTVVHESYNSRTLDFDIAGIQIFGSFALGASGVQKIGLPRAGQRPAAGVNSVVSGWGTIREGGPAASQLQAATVPIVSQASCRASYGTAAITDRMICVGFAAGGRDACQGDSGGPLAVGNTLVGIVSWGRRCARPNFPGVYTCTGNLRNWIVSVTGI